MGQRIFWAVTEGTVAAVLLIGGGLEALQTATIVTGLPFAIILIIMCYSLYNGLREDFQKMQKKKSQKQRDDYEDVVKEIVERRNKKA